jgi:bacterioferritin-associated ferredoxin
MRIVLRVLLVECALSWVMLLAGYAGVARQIWPHATARFRGRNWRVGLGLLIGLPLAAGWPAMFLARGLATSTHGDWLNLAIPWWLILGAAGGVVLAVTKIRKAEIRAELEAGCQCGSCVAYGRSVLRPGLTPAIAGAEPAGTARPLS